MNFHLFKYIVTGMLSFSVVKDDDFFNDLYREYKEFTSMLSHHYDQFQGQRRVEEFCNNFFVTFTPSENTCWLTDLYPEEEGINQYQDGVEDY